MVELTESYEMFAVVNAPSLTAANLESRSNALRVAISDLASRRSVSGLTIPHIAIATERSTFSIGEERQEKSVPMDVPFRVREVIGPARARGAVVSRATISARSAVQWGLIRKRVPEESRAAGALCLLGRTKIPRGEASLH